eukprot:SAG11_NODE_29192_length_313_cov_1.429907_1_plen_26_part_10
MAAPDDHHGRRPGLTREEIGRWNRDG